MMVACRALAHATEHSTLSEVPSPCRYLLTLHMPSPAHAISCTNAPPTAVPWEAVREQALMLMEAERAALYLVLPPPYTWCCPPCS